MWGCWLPIFQSFSEVIDGWEILISTMALKEKAELTCPPQYAYDGPAAGGSDVCDRMCLENAVEHGDVLKTWLQMTAVDFKCKVGLSENQATPKWSPWLIINFAPWNDDFCGYRKLYRIIPYFSYFSGTLRSQTSNLTRFPSISARRRWGASIRAAWGDCDLHCTWAKPMGRPSWRIATNVLLKSVECIWNTYIDL